MYTTPKRSLEQHSNAMLYKADETQKLLINLNRVFREVTYEGFLHKRSGKIISSLPAPPPDRTIVVASITSTEKLKVSIEKLNNSAK